MKPTFLKVGIPLNKVRPPTTVVSPTDPGATPATPVTGDCADYGSPTVSPSYDVPIPPATLIGDYLLMVVWVHTANNLATPSGWTLLESDAFGTNEWWMFGRVATTDDVAGGSKNSIQTITGDTNSSLNAFMVRADGTGSSFTASSAATNFIHESSYPMATFNPPAVTVPSAGDYLVIAGYQSNNGGTPPSTAPSGYTTMCYDNAPPSGGNYNGEISYALKTITTTEDPGAFSAAHGSGIEWVSFTVAIPRGQEDPTVAPFDHDHDTSDVTDVATASALGQLLVSDGDSWETLTVGSDDQVLTADSGEALGVKWAAAPGSSTDTDDSALSPDSTITSEKDSGNPTFNFDAIPENIIKVGDTYWCVYQGDWSTPTSRDARLASSTSRDGPWTAYGSNPILTAGSQAWESAISDVGINAPEIIEKDGTFYLFYSAEDMVSGTDGKIGVATATSITGPYTKSASNPILDVAGSGWDSRRVSEPSVIFHDGRWVMAFMAENDAATWGESEQVGVATADDPEGPWTKSASNPLITLSSGEWDDEIIADPFLFFENGYYWILYSGGPDPVGAGPSTGTRPWSLGLAYALDPVAGPWTRHASNPIVRNESSGFDEEAAWRGSVFIENGLLSGVYGGLNAALTAVKGGNFRLTVTAPSNTSDHGGLTGLSDDDHTQYSKADGTRAFSGTVSGVTPTSSAHLATKSYVDSNLTYYEVIVSGSAPPVAVTNEAEDDWVYGQPE